MFVVGIALWFGSMLEKDLWRWNLIGLMAHLPPLAINFILRIYLPPTIFKVLQ